MARKHPKRTTGSFLALPHHFLKHHKFGNLSGNAVKLLIEVIMNFSGFNNGDLSAPYSKLKYRGWKSKGTLSRAIKELLDTGFLIKTRQGGKHKCSLYGFSLWSIDECDGKLDIRSSKNPTNEWKN